MSLARGKYGIEYNPRPLNNDSGGMGWLLFTVAAVAVISLVWTMISRFRTREADEAVQVEQAEKADKVVVETPTLPASPYSLPTSHSSPAVSQLLMRLNEAERRNDLEMAVDAIETLRALPGSPAADLDDRLARRLGDLNCIRLFQRHNAQWVREVTVKRGASAARIANENGSTLASFIRLNGEGSENLVRGSKVLVMNHPRFRLVIHRRSMLADLSLNGKFFRRYDLLSEVSGKVGAYQLPEDTASFWRNNGIDLKPENRAELEMLMPIGASVVISDI